MSSNQFSAAAPYMHRCGHVYSRTVEKLPPQSRMMICDYCLEPMPVCDEHRNAYRYGPVTTSPREAARASTPRGSDPDLAIWLAAASAPGGAAKILRPDQR